MSPSPSDTCMRGKILHAILTCGLVFRVLFAFIAEEAFGSSNSSIDQAGSLLFENFRQECRSNMETNREALSLQYIRSSSVLNSIYLTPIFAVVKVLQLHNNHLNLNML